MKFPAGLDRVKLPQKDKNALISLKRRTGIGQWNTLCRWAFLLSLAEPKIPKSKEIIDDSNVEMDWKTFAGEYDQLLFHLLVERCLNDGLATDAQSLVHQLKLHLHRGIGYLAVRGKIADIRNLLQISLEINHTTERQEI